MLSADIEKDAADVPGYKKPLLLVDDIFLSLPGIDDKRLVTNYNNEDGPDPNDIKTPVEFFIAHDLCHKIFASSPLKESQEYDLRLHTLGINSPPYKPSSPTPSPIPIPAPIISIPVPPFKGKTKEPTIPTSPKKTFGDTCPKCRRPYKYARLPWHHSRKETCSTT